MCFSEFLAYKCGHTSVAVNRPCPLTTSIYNNPCCPRPAVRPFLEDSFCPGCSRIIHARTVDIIEHEHQWMHERGVCKCEVRFPALLGPRQIHRSSPCIVNGTTASGSGSPSQSQDCNGNGNGNGDGNGNGKSKRKPRKNRPKGKGKGKGKEVEAPVDLQVAAALGATSNNADAGPSGTQGEGTRVPALYSVKEVQNGVEVTIRLPSMHAAEWTRDHAILHHNDKCYCHVSFEAYQPYTIGEEDLGQDQDRDQDQDQHQGSADADNLYHNDSGSSISLEDSNITRAPASSPAITESNANEIRRTHSAPINPYGFQSLPQIPIGEPTHSLPSQAYNSILDNALGLVGPRPTRFMGKAPLDIQTAHYEMNESTPIAGCPITEGPQGGEGSDMRTIIECPAPQRIIAGFPLGAGPEGDAHSGSFEQCDLNLKALWRQRQG
ncbi:hypothetical protein GGS20DRAFT_555364 [Poronia punctata]|nr:hypothetical protein GGS20DRAFT_555364 [Poronia punctata]